jgi:ribosomal protein L11 methyltransferase
VSGQYTRYTLIVAPGSSSRDDAGAAPCGEALRYAHPEAVRLLRALGAEGWQDIGDGLVFWLPSDPAPDAALLRRLGRLGRLESTPQEEDWAVRWRRFHKPLAVGPLYVRPPWLEPRPGSLDLCIDPGLAFGTGGHATTRQCLFALTRLQPSGLIDLGAGSGVLALAAARLGFSPVSGLDVDPLAVDVARANAAANGLGVDFAVADVTDPRVPLPAVPLAVANLSLPVILKLATRIADQTVRPWRPRRLVLAGLLEEQGEQAAAAFRGYVVDRDDVDGDWVCLELEDVA